MWPNLWRVVNLIHILLILAHWFGCFYYLLSEVEGFQVSVCCLCLLYILFHCVDGVANETKSKCQASSMIFIDLRSDSTAITKRPFEIVSSRYNMVLILLYIYISKWPPLLFMYEASPKQPHYTARKHPQNCSILSTAISYQTVQRIICIKCVSLAK